MLEALKCLINPRTQASKAQPISPKPVSGSWTVHARYGHVRSLVLTSTDGQLSVGPCFSNSSLNTIRKRAGLCPGHESVPTLGNLLWHRCYTIDLSLGPETLQQFGKIPECPSCALELKVHMC